MSKFVSVRQIFILLICFQFLALHLWAQEDDYYQAEKVREPVQVSDLSDLYRWGPKFGVEVHSAFNYNHLLMALPIAGAFDKAVGGVGFDGGGGIRIRAYHKLSFSAGFDYAIRQFNLEYQAEEVVTGDPLDVKEKATMHYIGFYYKTLIEISKKFHLAQTFQYTWINSYSGTASAVNQSNGAIYPKQETTKPILDGWSAGNQAELGVEFAYKWKIAPQLILKPYIAISFGLTPTLNTNIYAASPFFGNQEQNPRYVNLKIGVIFETGLWMDQLKK